MAGQCIDPDFVEPLFDMHMGYKGHVHDQYDVGMFWCLMEYWGVSFEPCRLLLFLLDVPWYRCISSQPSSCVVLL
jgi:hypothetical protein